MTGNISGRTIRVTILPMKRAVRLFEKEVEEVLYFLNVTIYAQNLRADSRYYPVLPVTARPFTTE